MSVSSEAAIRTDALTKHYGRTVALEALSVDVRRGEVFGFLGPNGAGKTTTIRLLLGLIHATSGGARVLGLDPWRDPVELHRRIGYVPGDLSVWPQLTAWPDEQRFVETVPAGETSVVGLPEPDGVLDTGDRPLILDCLQALRFGRRGGGRSHTDHDARPSARTRLRESSHLS